MRPLKLLPAMCCLVMTVLSGLSAVRVVAAAAPTGFPDRDGAGVAGSAPMASAGQRPRIGLVLSGGGARGAAHVGVLKVLAELGVPIDAVAGTSMGAVVGGLYAAGLSPREIEAALTSGNLQDAFRDRPARSDLTFRRKTEDQNFLVRFPLGLKGGDFRLPKGLSSGQKLNQILRRLTLPVASVHDFNALPTPFRAVATDLESGEAVVLGDGDLVTAMRASISAPGVFIPVERDGRMLVDGGLVENLPVDVARAMGVDRLIVVDVGFPLQSRDRLDSVGSISNQMLAILIRRGSNLQRARIGADDVLLDPALGEASSFDFSLIPRAIEAGEAAARAQLSQLAALALPAAEYQRYQARRQDARQGVPRIDYIAIADGARRYRRPLTALFEPLVGTKPDAVALETRVTALYGQGNLETLDYDFERSGDRQGLRLSARRNSWGPNYVRFGLNLQDDFAGNSSYNAAARFVLSEITARGGEWVFDLQIGESPRLSTEVFLPLDYSSGWFVMPLARFEARNVPLLDASRRLAEFRVRTFESGLDLGRELGNWGEARIGVRRQTGRSRVRVGDPALPTGDFDARSYFARFSYDRLDDVNFPREGQSLEIEWRGERTGLGSGRSADLVTADWRIARSIGRHTAVFWASGGTNLDAALTDVRSRFSLGGFLNLSGLPPASISGNDFAIARLLYYRKIGSGGEGFLNVPAYLGLSYEVGNVWESRSDARFSGARQNGSLFLGLDTLLGPLYLGAGIDERGDNALYLFLGRTF